MDSFWKEKEETNSECVTSGSDWWFRARFFGNTWFSLCFDALMLETENELVIPLLVWSILPHRSDSFTSFILLLRFRNLWIFPSSSQIRTSVIAFRAYCFLRWTLCLNCRGLGSVMKVQSHLWELMKENSIDLFEFASEKTVRVREMFFKFSSEFREFDPTDWRENFLMCLWGGIKFVDLFLTCTVPDLI